MVKAPIEQVDCDVEVDVLPELTSGLPRTESILTSGDAGTEDAISQLFCQALVMLAFSDERPKRRSEDRIAAEIDHGLQLALEVGCQVT